MRGIREDKVTKRQKQGLTIPNSESVNPDKPFITDKYNNQNELKKIERIKYLAK